MKDIKLKHGCVLIFCGLLLLNSLTAQPIKNGKKLSASQLSHLGKNAAEQGDIYSAIDYLSAYCPLKPKDYKIIYLLAQEYRASRDYQQAELWYLKAYEAAPNENVLALFYRAQMLKSLGQCREAIKLFDQFKNEYQSGKTKKGERNYKKLAEIGISGCTLSDKSLDSSSSLIITHLDSSINKAHIEFSPIAINDSTFIYASLKLDSSQFFANEDIEKIPVRKFYVGEKRGDKWKYKSPLAGPFNEPGVNTGNGAFCPDKKHFYFTKCNKEGNSKVNCAIYMSINKGGHWSTPEKLDDAVNLSPYTSTQPAVGTESKGKKEILYFVSDRPEGLGGLDLWYSVYNPRDKTFKKPKNLGNGINTNGDEYTPFYEEETRTLYFSTDGWPGIGGLDIFKSNGELTQWTQAQNIGKPINSSYDDLYYTLDEERKTGFFTSNRPGGVALENATCCDDIYSFERKHITAVVVAGKIKLENSAESLENVSVSLTLLVGKQRPILLHTDSITANGDYSFKVESGNDYSLTIRKPGYFTHQIRFSTKVPIKADTIIVETATIKAIPLEQGIVMPNIHYATNKFELSDANKMALDTTLLVVLIDNPDFKVEIGAHTDNQGNDGANQILSQRRAEGLVKYLISKGVSPRRLTATGYGETMPIAPNQTPDGIDDPIAMQKNRRTEFKIIANKF